MASIFTKDDNFVDKPKRNTFDLSFQNNLSLKFGKLIPAYLQEVIPGDSIHIDPTFGLRFLPQVFPVQTRMRAHLHFFYVRNRTIWKNWMDFIGKTKEGLVLPYLAPDRGEQVLIKESSIFDYMGLPYTVNSSVDEDNLIYSRIPSESENIVFDETIEKFVPVESLTFQRMPVLLDPSTAQKFVYNRQNVVVNEGNNVQSYVMAFEKPVKIKDGSQIYLKTNATGSVSTSSPAYYYILTKCTRIADDKVIYLVIPRGAYSGDTDFTIDSNVNYDGFAYNIDTIYGYYYPYVSDYTVTLKVGINPSVNPNYPISGLSDESQPYGDSSDSSLRISALPFRAYEAVYNSFYRNPENNPFLIGGKPEYNRYIVNDEDGPCRLGEFQLFNRNWEDDAFTTAVPTPQQGDAPRVGLTADKNTPVFLNYSREDGSVGKLVLEADADGYVYAVSDGNLTGVPDTDVENSSMANMLNDVVQFGITISDLRNVNSFQRWLEKNVRKGYRYRDQLMSHYGVSVSYKDMMMPEFIGGMSRDVTVNQISQTVETATGNLGDMAGQAYVVGDGKRISHFCDEHGYIIGILSVAPVPNYSQMIPKHFFKHDALDYFFPEFGKIGMQPITNKEIASISSVIEGKANNTFGYQRAWYDYLARVDEVHGKFNSDFFNFLIQRRFFGVPELGAKFTTIENDDLNNIFYVDDGEDKILGQIYYNVSGIRPIPMYGIPALE